MLRNTVGKLLISGFVVAICAKTATSFPMTPKPFEAPFLEYSQSLHPAAQEVEGNMVFDSNDLSNLNLFGGDEPLPTCETPEQILQSLTEERLLLDAQKVNLSNREAEVALAREKLDIEKAALMELKSSVEQLLKRIDAQQTEDLDRLIALYQNMKPAEAAAIMNDLDIEVMIMVLGTMPPRVAAPIMAKMTPVRARAVSKIILERSKLPGDQNLNGIQFD